MNTRLCLALAITSASLCAQTQPGTSTEPLFAPRERKEHIPEATEFSPIFLRDADGDGRADLFDARLQSIAWSDPGGRYREAASLPVTFNQSSGSLILESRTAVADVDGLGAPDIVFGSDSGLYVMDSNGTRSFAAPRLIDARVVFTLVALDADLDGDDDIVVTSVSPPQTQEVLLYTNQGAGTFAAPVVLATRTHPRNLIVRAIRFDSGPADDLLIIAPTNRPPSPTVVVLQSGPVGYTQVDLTSSFSATQEVLVGDFDGDGDDDFAGAQIGVGQQIYENRNGVLGPPLTVPGTLMSGWNEVLDLDGDGFADLLAWNSETTQFFRGRGDLTFDTPVPIAPSEFLIFPRHSIGDANGDGVDDCLIGADSEARLVLGQAGGPPRLADSRMFSEVLSERLEVVGRTSVDNDGREDFVLRASPTSTTGPRPVSFGRYVAAGRIELQTPGSSQPDLSDLLVLADFDQDGREEALSTGATNRRRLVRLSPSPAAVQSQDLFREVTRACALDVDADGDLDLVAIDGSVGTLFWLRNDPGVVFREQTQTFPVATERSAQPVAIDLDGDGDEDLVLVPGSVSNNPARSVELPIWRNDGAGQFTRLAGPTLAPSVPAPNATYDNPTVVDADGDGDLDLWISGRNDALLNDGLGGFTQLEILFQGQEPLESRLVDLDSDGRNEILGYREDPTGIPSQTISIWRATTGGFALDSNNLSAGFETGLERLIDLDNDGDLDVAGLTPITNRAIDLHTRFLPAIGLDFPVEMRLAAGGPSLSRFGALGIAASRPSRPIQTPLGDFDLLNPFFLPYQVLPNNGDPITVDLRVPNQSALVGVEFFLQASFVHVGPSLQLRFFRSAVLREEIAR